MNTPEGDQVLDVSLRELVLEFRSAQESVANELRESSQVLSSADDSSDRLELLEEAMKTPELRLQEVRDRLGAIQHILATLLGPPPPIERDDVRRSLEAMRAIDAEMRRSTVRFADLVACSNDDDPSDYAERLSAESSRFHELVAQKSALSEELFSVLRDESG